MEKGLVKASINLPGFVEDAYKSVDAMEKFSQLLLDSKLCPDHFYEKKEGENKPDYTKGKTAAVMMVLLQGHQLNLPPLTALQHVIPVNGLLSIKGDAAKTLIFNSGKLEPGTWQEQVSGSLANGDYQCTITAKRSDTKETMSRTFGVVHAKRAGLWVDEAKIRGNEGWKYQKSAWYKYPERMIAYRALGFLARDLFPDVLSGIYTTEEAIDMPVDTEVVVETASGAEIVMPDKDFHQNRSENLTQKASDQIDKRAGKLEPDPPTPPVEHDAMPDDSQAKDHQKYPMTPDEAHPAPEPDPNEGKPETERASIAVMLNGTQGFIPVYTEDELKEMDVKDLHGLIECDGLMTMAREKVPGQNTNKKLRGIILRHYDGQVVPLIAQHDPEFQDPLNPPKEETPPPSDPVQEEGPPMEAVGDQEEEPPQETEPIPSEDAPQSDIPANTSFDQEPDPAADGNKFNIEVPELVDGKRGFDQVKSLYEELASVAGLDNKAFESLIATKFPQFQHYRVKEDFCYKAPAHEINTLLNSI